jgi:hypothetical protein
MSFLTLPVGDILESFAGDSREYRFEGEIPSGYYDDLEFTAPLAMMIRVIGLDDGVEVVIESLKTRILWEESEREIALTKIVRSFKKTYDPLGPDDVRTIDMKHRAVELDDVVREEILIACM